MRSNVMTGKLEGIGSLSTSCEFNPICIARMESSGEYGICGHCYSHRGQQYKATLKELLRKNTLEMKDIIPWDDLPVTTEAFVRLEAFGDISCRNHLINYIRICEKNPQSMFALWTKNYGYLISVFSEYIRPDNLAIVLSSPNIGEELPKEIIDKVEAVVHVDTLFTVYGKADFLNTPENERCGMKCIVCRKCYERHAATMKVAEKLK